MNSCISHTSLVRYSRLQPRILTSLLQLLGLRHCRYKRTCNQIWLQHLVVIVRTGESPTWQMRALGLILQQMTQMIKIKGWLFWFHNNFILHLDLFIDWMPFGDVPHSYDVAPRISFPFLLFTIIKQVKTCLFLPWNMVLHCCFAVWKGWIQW